jgi:hypothetical protein
MSKSDKPYANGLVIYGKVIRHGQHLKLVDINNSKVMWKIDTLFANDTLFADFVGKEICVTIELISHKKIGQLTC